MNVRIFMLMLSTTVGLGPMIALGGGCTGTIADNVPPGGSPAGSPGAGAGGTTGAGAAAGAMGGNSGTGLTGGPPAGPPGVLSSAYTRLTRAEYQATIKTAFGVDAPVTAIPDDSRVGAFTSNVNVSPDPLQPYLLAGEDLVATLVPTAKFPACASASAATCVTSSYRAPIELLFRRALSAAELTGLSDMITSLQNAGVTPENATRTMVTSALISPDFMFRTTPLTGDAARARRLTDHLSYALWDAPPDTQLVSAGQGPPADLGARLGTQALRLVKDPRAVPVLARFMAQWLRVDVDIRLQDAGYATSPIYAELLAFVQDALATDAPVTSFVNGTRGFVQKNDFPAYGLAAVASTANVVAITWPASSARRGVVGQEAIIDPTRHPDATRRPIFRGHLVRSSLLCDNIPPPPPELQALAGEVADRTTDMRCAGCHNLMEPVGAAFASMDLDHTGPTPPAQLNAQAELGGTYADLPALMNAIAGSQTFASCFARQILGFFLEQAPTDVDAASVADVAAIVRTGGGLGDVVGQMIVSLEARSQGVAPWCKGQ